jgi:predicted AAA+ superfamily ATPase
MEATDIGLSDKTIQTYMNALRRIFVIEDLPAWAPSLRSKTAIRTSEKRHFVDPSIATAVLRTNPKGILADFTFFGFLFEALCTRDIRIYAQAIDGDV